MSLGNLLLSRLRLTAAALAAGLATWLSTGRLLGSLSHLLFELTGLIGNIVLLAGHLVERFGRQRGDALRLVLQLGERPLQVGDGAFFILLRGLSFRLLQVAFRLPLVLNGLTERLFARLW